MRDAHSFIALVMYQYLSLLIGDLKYPFVSVPVLKSRGKAKKNKLLKKDSPQDSDSMEEMFANVVPSISASSRVSFVYIKFKCLC